jgi:glycosyltransferase involved in cell wall biosynthesis
MELKKEKKYSPLVSIIIPVYNGSNYLKQAIDSALSQTYKNIEVVVVNDGSTDNTEKIAKDYGDKIRYFKKENGGVATALNLGIEKMAGEYFSWLSHDDVYYPNKIEKQIHYINEIKDRKVILYSNYEVINKNSAFVNVIKLDHSMLELKPEYAVLRGAINGITLLIPRVAFKKYGGFNAELKYTQDYDLWWRLLKYYKFIHMEDVLVKYRSHEDQGSVKFSESVNDSEARWISTMEDLTKDDKERLEGSEYNFYLNMYAHLSRSSRRKACGFANTKRNEIYEKVVKKNYKISVIIPCYNQGRFIDKAVDSVLAQTYDNFEIIIINDGSTDEYTNKLLKKYNKPKTRIYNTKNRGSSMARKYGISKAKGEYIQLLDADDYIAPNKFEEQMKVFNTNHKTNICYTGYEYYLEDEDRIEIPQLSMVLSDKPIEDFLYRWQRSLSIPIHSAIFEKKILNSSIKMPIEIKSTEDWIMWVNLAKIGANFSRIDLPLATYRVHGQGKSVKDKKRLFYWASRSVSYLAENLVPSEDSQKFHLEQTEYLAYLARVLIAGDIIEINKALEKRMDNLEEEIIALKFKNQRIIGSLSWKVTKPLRSGRRIIRKIRNLIFKSISKIARD